MLHDIRVPFHDSGGARNGQIVVIGLTVPPGRNQEPLGKVIEVLGHAGDPGIEYRIVQHRYGLPVKFNREAENEAARIPDHVLDSELRGREDFRAELAVTIDGEDARDFDDAITLKRLPGGRYLLGVHISASLTTSGRDRLLTATRGPGAPRSTSPTGRFLCCHPACRAASAA